MADFLPPDFEKDPFYRFPTFFERFAGYNQGVTIYEENNQIIVEAEMPGLSVQDIHLGLSGDLLTIQGKKERSDKENKTYRDRSFSYSLLLDKKIDSIQEPKASYKDGILKIVFAKAKTAEPRKISIKVE